MIRFLACLAAVVLLAGPAVAAAPAPTDSAVVEPALQQCILAATVQSGDSDGGPLITDCISVGSAACQNEQSSRANAVVIRCDSQELAFWDALVSFETTALQHSLKPEGLGALRASQKAWTTWKSARCDFVRKSEQDTTLTDVDVSYCVMETTALRAIDLMAAL